jgi:hypothetical protein
MFNGANGNAKIALIVWQSVPDDDVLFVTFKNG